MAKKQVIRSIQANTDGNSTDRKPERQHVVQSESETIRRRLHAIENNFHLLDEQLDQIEARMLIEPLLSQDASLPAKPR
jgi:hypothetical protein